MKRRLSKTNSDAVRRRRTGALLLPIDDDIGDLIAVASIREQLRIFGLDRVRGL
jgi:hypothetical protein